MKRILTLKDALTTASTLRSYNEAIPAEVASQIIEAANLAIGNLKAFGIPVPEEILNRANICYAHSIPNNNPQKESIMRRINELKDALTTKRTLEALNLAVPKQALDTIEEAVKITVAYLDAFGVAVPKELDIIANAICTHHQEEEVECETVSSIIATHNNDAAADDAVTPQTEAQEAEVCPISAEEFIHRYNQLTEGQCQKLDSIFSNMLSELPVRAQNVLNKKLRKEKTQKNKYAFIINYQQFDFGTLGNCGKGTKKELNDFCKKFCETIASIMQRITSSPETEEQLLVSLRYPFLNNDDIDQYIDIRQGSDLAASMYVVAKYIASRQKQNSDIIASYYGLWTDEMHNREQIAKEHSITQERVRQIIGSKLSSEEVKDDLGKIERAFDNAIYTESHPLLRQMAKTLNLSPFAVMGIILLACGSYTICNTNLGYFLVQKSIVKTINICGTITNIQRLAGLQKMWDETKRIAEVVDCPANAQFTNEHIKALAPLFEHIAQSVTDVEMAGENLIFKANKICRPDIIFGILEKNGKPMHFHQIYGEYLSLTTDDKDATIDNIRFVLLNDSRFQAVGKSGYWKLSTWDHVFEGSITDYAAHVLSEISKPLNTQQILSLLADYPQQTNDRSLTELMSNDDRFVTFEGRLYGLKGKTYPSAYRISAPITRRHRISA